MLGAEAVVGMRATHTEPVAFSELLSWSRDSSVIFRRALWLGIKCQDQGIGSWPITCENTALFIMGARVVPFLPTDLHGGLVHVGVCRRGLSVRKEVSEKPGSGASATVLPVVEEQRKSGKTSVLLGKTTRVM